MKSKKIKITLQDLLEVTQKGFERVDRRFDEVDKRFDEMDKRFDRLEGRVEKVEFNTNGNERRISNLEDDVRIIKTKIDLK